MKRNILLVATGMIVAIAVLAALRATAWQPAFKEGQTPTLAPLLQRVTPAVVNIAVVGAAAEAHNPLLEDPSFRRFFEGPDAPLLPPSAPRQSIGSGVIIDGNERLVVTNHHVVQGADSIIVTLSDRREYTAMLVGSDAGTDIALLRVMADDTPFAEIPIGDSNAVSVGDYVVAIGNPFGLGQTATAGIVSAMGRSGVNIESFEDFIQTDASINPGNSGGALVDINGRLLGVNTAILSGTGGNIGIGFAIPSNMVRQVVEQLLEHGNVQRGRIGVAIQDVTPGLAQALELTTDHGALVTQVEPGSPAEQAGIQAGDVVVAIGDQAIDSSADVRNTVGLVRAGESVAITAIRGGDRRTVRTTVAPDVEPGDATARPADPSSVSLLAGATIMELPRDHPAYGRANGVWVSAVAPGSVAARFGLRADDVITGVNRNSVESVGALTAALNSVKPPIALQVQREGRSLFLLVR
ncbi:MAG TPA: Do family serine endopeptidase [Gammaproteobacteria bacterium]